ncbi:MAG: hypothetical protein ACQERB_01855 [Promethearchaeati archaeon]|nr:MAG: hypothetical protein EU543_02050 [Candidatus Lokiarchaeota archaeon]
MNSTGNRDKFDFEKLDIIKRYFSRRYTVVSKDVREILLKLEVSKKELKEILKAIAFLPEEKQKEFLSELIDENED